MTLTPLALILTWMFASVAWGQASDRPWLGIRVEAVVDASGRELLRVQHVTPLSPAALAGLHSGDLILGTGGENLARQEGEGLIAAFLRQLGGFAAGDDITVQVRRAQAGDIAVEITLGRRPPPRRLEELRFDLAQRQPDWQPLWDQALRAQLDPLAAIQARAILQVIARSEYDPVPDSFRLEDVALARRSPTALACIADDLSAGLTGDGLSPDLNTILAIMALHQGEFSMLDMRRASTPLAPPAQGQSAVDALLRHLKAVAPLFQRAQASCGGTAEQRLRLAQGGAALVRRLARDPYLRDDPRVAINQAHLRTLRAALSVDRRALLVATAAVVALRDFVLAVPPEDWESGDHVSALGVVVIGTPGNDDHFGSAAVVIDPGGNDRYRKGSCAITHERHPLGLVIDLGPGNDTYTGNDRGLQLGPAGAACGVAFLYDQGGDDVYVGGSGGCAGALAGVAILEDAAGNDRYTVEQHGIGSAWVGTALLLDRSGNDEYVAGRFAQGAAGPGGMGALIDMAGDDVYRLRQHSEGDAESGGVGGQGYGLGPMDPVVGVLLSGGLGVLVDRGGADNYHSSGRAMGCGVAYGMGILADHDGADVYHGGGWSLGAGVHAGVGAIIEHGGDDRYELIDAGGLGWGRDLGFGLTVDRAGDDTYVVTHSALGFATMSSLGACLDLQGADRYEWTPPALGASEEHPQRPGASLGIWIDAGDSPELYTVRGTTQAELPGSPDGAQPGLRWELPMGLERAIETFEE